MEYEVFEPGEIPRRDLASDDRMPPDLDIRAIDQAMGLESVRVKLWYFEPGDEIGYHAHAEQEELFYILKGEFSLKLGRSGDTEIRTVGPGSIYGAGPGIGHGHRYLGDDEGVMLAIGAPPVDDPGLNPHELPADERDEDG